MKKLFVLLFCIGAFGAHAQNFNWADSPVDTARGSSSDFELISTSYFKNSGDDTTFVWLRTSDIPNAWENTICDLNTCYGELVDSAQFILPKGDSFKMKANFYANNVDGIGCVTLKIVNLEDRSQSVTKEFCASTILSAKKPSLQNQVRVYPNPAQDEINVKIERNGNYTIRIYDIVGNVVYKSNGSAMVKTIPISKLNKGVYFVNVEAGGLVANKSFVKRN